MGNTANYTFWSRKWVADHFFRLENNFVRVHTSALVTVSSSTYSHLPAFIRRHLAWWARAQRKRFRFRINITRVHYEFRCAQRSTRRESWNFTQKNGFFFFVDSNQETRSELLMMRDIRCNMVDDGNLHFWFVATSSATANRFSPQKINLFKWHSTNVLCSGFCFMRI